jgi:prepilin-type N-terminal cleavage/methylation domain-containing protein
MLRVLKNRKGATLTELIVAMLVLSIIMIAVTTVFLPTYNAYVHANNFAEINLLLDTLSAYIISDVESAREVVSLDPLEIRTNMFIRYGTNNHQLTRRVGDLTNPFVPVLDGGYYRRKGVEINSEENGGIVTVTLTIFEVNRDGTRGGDMATRAYVARPIGLQ